MQLVSPEWIGVICTAGSLVLTFFALSLRRIIKLFKWLWRISHRTEQFLEDFHGTPPRPGVPARPGVMERLQTIEGNLAGVQAELSYNSGSTLKDAVRRIDQNVYGIATAQGTQPRGVSSA